MVLTDPRALFTEVWTIPASYLVIKDPVTGYYWVKNGITASIEKVVNDPNHAEEAIQYAIDSLPAEGGNIILSRGTFNFSPTTVGFTEDTHTVYLGLNINKDRVSIRGQGMGTVIRLVSNPDRVSIIYVTKPFFELGDLEIDGNKAAFAPGANVYAVDLTEGADYALLENPYIHDNGYCSIRINGSNFGTLRNLRLESNYNYGIYATGASIEMKLSDVYIYNNGYSGMVAEKDISDWRLTRITSNNNGQVVSAHGIYWQGHNSRLVDIICNNNTEYGLRLNWASVALCYDNMVQGAYCSGNGLDGIVAGGRNNVLIGCICPENSRFGISLTGWEEGSADVCHDNTLIGCHAYKNGSSGLRLSGTARIRIEGCHSYNNGQDTTLAAGDRCGLQLNNYEGNGPLSTQVIGGEYFDNQVTKTQQWGIYVGETGCDYLQLLMPRVYGNATGQVDYWTNGATNPLWVRLGDDTRYFYIGTRTGTVNYFAAIGYLDMFGTIDMRNNNIGRCNVLNASYFECVAFEGRIDARNIDYGSIRFRARRTGVGLEEVARVKSADEPSFYIPRFELSYDSGDYGGNFATYTPPTGWEGRVHLAEDTNATAPGRRIYVYIGGAWRYADLT